MDNDEIKSKQEETLNNLKKYNENRKTKFIDAEDFDGPEPEWIDVDVEIVNDPDEMTVSQEFLNKVHGSKADYDEEYTGLLGDEPLVPKLTLVHREETFVEEDPSEYTEIEVVPFFEEDEPIENILAAFERGEKGVTVPPMQEWLDAQDKLNKDRGTIIGEKIKEEKFGQLPEPITEITGDSVNPIMERQTVPICQFCANFVYQGQLHGPGYCKEKVQYQQ